MGIVILILLFVSKFVIKEPNVLILTKNRISHLRSCVQLSCIERLTTKKFQNIANHSSLSDSLFVKTGLYLTPQSSCLRC